MKKTITVRNVKIGEGTPKICVSLIGRTISELIDESTFLKTLDLDIVEWRVDFFQQVEEITKVIEALREIRSILADTPLIFTFRSKSEGGEKEVTPAFYKQLIRTIVETGLVDIIDVELFKEENVVKSLVEVAHRNNVFVIISNHDFEKTPPKDEIVARLRHAQALGGDIPKIAVMPQNTGDVLTLLDATNTMFKQFADRPIVTISMGGKGAITRISGETFGSTITFAAAKKSSAPGQIDATALRGVLNLFHSNLE